VRPRLFSGWLMTWCSSKIVTTLVSLFTSFYVRMWPTYFPDDPLPPEAEAPSFDGRSALHISLMDRC
jgi:tRNA(His) guanylyltransferase